VLRVAIAALLALPVSHAAAQGVLPSRSYAPDQRYQIISPPMGATHHNQPSVVNGHLMLAGNGEHTLWDISDPFSPEEVSGFLSPHRDGEAESHQVAFLRRGDRHLCATISGRGIDLWDLTDVTAPELLSTIELEGVDYGDNSEAVWGIFWQGDYVYVGGTNTGLHVVDASDPTSPTLVTRLPSSAFGNVSAGPLWAVGNLLVITTPKNHAGIATLDISNPDEPALLDFVRPEEDSYIGGFYGRYAHLVHPFRTYDVTTDPADIQLVSTVVTPETEYVSFGDGFLFLGSLRPNPGIFKHDLDDLETLPLEALIQGRRDNPLFLIFTDDQFSLPIGNLLVISDDEVSIGSVLAVHDTRRDSVPPRVEYVNPPPDAVAMPTSSRVGLSFSDQLDLRTVDPSTVIVRPVGGEALSGDYGHVQTVLSFWPDAPFEADTTYEILVPAGGVKDLAGNAVTEEFRSVFSTGDDIVAPTCAIEAPTPVAIGDATLRATDAGDGATYEWRLGEDFLGSGEVITHPFDAGRHSVTLRVSVDGATRSCSATQIVHHPLEETPANHGSTVAIDAENGRAWTVNPDADTVAAVDMGSLERTHEVSVGDHPRTLAFAPDGNLWVACQDDDTIHVIDADGAPVTTHALPHGSGAYGVAFRGDAAYVTLENAGALLRLDLEGEVTGRLELGHAVRGISLRDGVALVTRFRSPDDAAELYEIDTEAMSLNRTITLAREETEDSASGGRGVPSYLSHVAISPDGRRAWIPSKKDNVARGMARDGMPLNTDNTVRAIVTQVDLESGAEAGRFDIDDHDMPFASVFSPRGDLVFVVSQGTNRVDVFDTVTSEQVAGFATELAPQGLALHEGRLYVQAFMGRTLDVYDVSGILDGTDSTARDLARVGTQQTEALPEDVLLGKQIFYNADSPQMSLDGYVACASCHLDGGHDGRVWDFTDRGEGFRNTTDLRGRGGTAHGPVHWSGNFDEIQDFENDIRLHFGGAGLMRDEDFEATRDTLGEPKAGRSAALDALAAYVASLDAVPRSPHREADGMMTEEARAGREVFERLDCLDCHGGERLTDSGIGPLHDVGTIVETSGKRLGETLLGIDTPTLRGVWAGAPYFHDGSAATLEDVLSRGGHGNAQDLDAIDRDALIAFLLQLENEPVGYAEPMPPAMDGGVAMPDGGVSADAGTTEGGGGCDCSASGPADSAWVLLGLALLWRRRR